MATWLKRGLPDRVVGMGHRLLRRGGMRVPLPTSRGTTMTLPAKRPSARPTSASEIRSKGTSSASMSRSVGNPSVSQQVECLLEAAQVVDEGADDGELVEDEPVGVELGMFDAGTDQGQGPPAAQLVEPGLHGRLLARALEHHVDGGIGEPLGLPGREGLEVGGVEHLGRHRGRGRAPAPFPRLDGDDRSDAPGHQRGDGEGADRARTR